jgi:hypothetical protein
MTITFACPGCAKRYEVDTAMAGKRAKCKQCGHAMTVPAASGSTPSSDPYGLADEPMAARPVRGHAARPAPADEIDQPAPPTRARPRATRTVRTANAGLPLSVKALLTLLGGLLAVSFVGLVVIGLAEGKPALVLVALEMFVACAFAGLAGVSNLKIVFMASAEGRRTGRGFLFSPFYVLDFVVRHWEDTKGLFLAWVTGLAGLVLWSIFVLPHVKAVGGPGARGGSGQSVELIVTEVPDGDARAVFQEKLKALSDRFGVTSMSGSSESGKPDRIVLSPVRDPRAFAAAITFGTVTSVWGREIHVTAAPVSAEEIAAQKARQAEADADRQGDVAARPAGPALPTDAAAVTQALSDLKSSDPGKQKEAVQRLARTAPDERRAEVVAALRPLLEDKDFFLASDVIKTLTVWNTPEVVPALIAMLPDEQHRDQVIKALGTLRDPRAIEPMLAYLKTSGFQVEDALRKLGPDAEPALINRLRDADPAVRRQACVILEHVGGAKTLAFMQSAPPDPDASVRMAAQDAIRTIAARNGVGRSG